jgi:hypothetical protein
MQKKRAGDALPGMSGAVMTKAGVRSKRCPVCFMPLEHYDCLPEHGLCREPPEFVQRILGNDFYEHEVRRRRERLEKLPRLNDEVSRDVEDHANALVRYAFRTRQSAQQWFVDFLSIDPSVLTDQQWHELQCRITSVTQLGVLDGSARNRKGKIEATRVLIANTAVRTTTHPWNRDNGTGTLQTSIARVSSEHPREQRLPSKRTVLALQQRVKRLVNELFETGATVFPRPPNRIMLMLDNQRCIVDDFLPAMESSHSPESCFLFRCGELVVSMAAALHCCPKCRKVFLASRRDKRYCSENCQSCALMRRRRGTPLERYGKPGRRAIKRQSVPTIGS